jgi:type II secretory pathway component PulF
MSDESGRQGAGERLSGREATELTGQIAGLASAGLPMAPSLAALAEELPRGRLRRAMQDLSDRLAAGTPLEEAIEDQRGRIPPHLRGLVIAGARGKRLGDVLGQFSGYVEIGSELRRRLWLTLAYPILSMAIAIAIFTFVSLVVVPQFAAIFQNFGVPLPRATVAILDIAEVMSALGPLLGILAAALVALRVVSPLFLRPATLRAIAARLPIVGGVWRWTSLAEFCHLLGLLLESHLPMPEALRLTGEGVQDADVEGTCLRMADGVESGQDLARAMAERRLFPVGLPRLVRWGERQGGLTEVLHMAGEMFEARASAHATFAGTVLAVLAVLMILWGLFTVVGGLMLPMITLISKLAG